NVEAMPRERRQPLAVAYADLFSDSVSEDPKSSDLSAFRYSVFFHLILSHFISICKECGEKEPKSGIEFIIFSFFLSNVETMHEDGAQRNPHCMRRLVLGVMLKFQWCSAYRGGVRQIQIPIKISRSSRNILAHFKHMNDPEHQASIPFDHK